MARRSGRLDQAVHKLVEAWAYLPFPLVDLAEVAGERRDPEGTAFCGVADLGGLAGAGRAELLALKRRRAGMLCCTSIWTLKSTKVVRPKRR